MRKFILVIFSFFLITTLVKADNREQPLVDFENEYLAQLVDDLPHPGPGGPPDGRHPKRGDMKRFEQLRLVKLLELLDLGEDKETEFIPIFRSHRKGQIQLAEERNKVIRKLGQGIRNQQIDDSEIMSIVDEIKQLDQKRQNEFINFFEKLENILSPSQLGKIYVFQARFGAEVLGKMQDFQRNRGGWGRNRNFEPNPKDSN